MIKYRGIIYDNAVHARWACFFDLVAWRHQYKPSPIPNWHPTFRVEFTCGHSECEDYHSLLVDATTRVGEMKESPGRRYPFGHLDSKIPVKDWHREWDPEIDASASAVFGFHPSLSEWEMSHGAGGGTHSVQDWVPDWERVWSRAVAVITELEHAQQMMDVRFIASYAVRKGD